MHAASAFETIRIKKIGEPGTSVWTLVKATFSSSMFVALRMPRARADALGGCCKKEEGGRLVVTCRKDPQLLKPSPQPYTVIRVEGPTP